MFLLAKWMHVLSAALWFGGGVVLLVLYGRLGRGDPGFARALAARIAPLGSTYFGPLGGLTLVTGLWAVGSGGYSFLEPFVIVGYGGVLVSSLLGARGAGATAEAIAAAPSEAEVPALQRRLMAFAATDAAVLALVVGAMVTKPG